MVKEICEGMEMELDLCSVGGKGYGVSLGIDRNINLLISRLDSVPDVRPYPPRPQALNVEDGGPFYSRPVMLRRKLSSHLMRGHPLRRQTIQGSPKHIGSSSVRGSLWWASTMGS